MNTMLKRSIATSFLFLCLTFSVFAEGDQGAGSRTGTDGNGLATVTDNKINSNDENPNGETIFSFIEWISQTIANSFS